jgi:hypothetical protein
MTQGTVQLVSGILAVILIAIVLLRRKGKKKKSEEDDEFLVGQAVLACQPHRYRLSTSFIEPWR